MWAPADLFGPGLSLFLDLLRDIASYFYQHLMVLAAVLILVALLITAVTMIGNRRARRT